MTSISIRTTGEQASALVALAQTLASNPHGDVTITLAIEDALPHREPAEGYMWNCHNYHPKCLIKVMIKSRHLAPAAEWDMTPAEAIRQYRDAMAFNPSSQPFHIEPVNGTELCSGCGEPWEHAAAQ